MTKLLNHNPNQLAALVVAGATALFFLDITFSAAAYLILAALVLYSVGRSWLPLVFCLATAAVYYLATIWMLPWPSYWYPIIRLSATILTWTMLLTLIPVLAAYLFSSPPIDTPASSSRQDKGDTPHQGHTIQ